MASSDFIQKFNSLKGDTVGERKKSLFQLLNKFSTLKEDPKCMEEILQNLRPATFLEEHFRVELLIFFRRSNDLYTVFKEGNEVFISQIIKHSWFFADIFGKVSGVQFVDEIMPVMSYSIRMKVLKKVSVFIHDEDKINEIFNAVLITYGLHNALCLLPGCSISKIQEVIVCYEVVFNKSQILYLYKKNPELVVFHLKELKNRKTNISFESQILPVYQKLAKDYPSILYELIDTLKLKPRFGRRISKKMIPLKEDEIVKDPKEFILMFKEDALVRKLGLNFEEFLKNYLPVEFKNLRHRWDTLIKILKHYPNKKQYNLLIQALTNKYKNNEICETKFLQNDILKLCPSSIERESWIAKFSQDPAYMKYYDVDKSFTYFKDKINLTSSKKDRSNCLVNMVESCKINKSLDALETLLQYYVQRHRNDDSEGRSDFLRAIFKYINLNELEDNHWNLIKTIIAIQITKKEAPDNLLWIKHIEYQYKQQRDTGPEILSYVKATNYGLYEFMNLKIDLNPTFIKYLIENTMELIPQLVEKENMTALYTLFLDIKSYNKAHSTDSVNIFESPKILEMVANNINDEIYEYDNCILKTFEFILKDWNSAYFNNKDRQTIEKIYLTKYSHNLKHVMKWYLKYYPRELLKYPINDKICSKLLCKTYFSLIRKMEHLNLPQTIINFITHSLNETENNKKKTLIVGKLPYIISTEKYINIVQKYRPTTDKIDDNDVDIDLVDIQNKVANSFKKCDDLKRASQELMHYVKGDYLSAALCSLYSIYYRLPESELNTIRIALKDKAVSVRKHIFLLDCSVSRILVAKQILLQFGLQEKNPSVKKRILDCCFTYFIRNESEDLWHMLKNCISNIDKDDNESIELLGFARRIPKKYRAHYVIYTYNILETFFPTTAEITLSKQKLISVGSEEIKHLSTDFIISLITKNFLKIGPFIPHESCVGNFAVQFLLNGTNVPPEERVELVMKLINNYKNTYWNRRTDLKNAKSLISGFVDKIFSQVLLEKSSIEVLTLFKYAFENEFSDLELFDDLLKLRLALIFMDSLKDDSFAYKLNVLFQDYMAKYTPFLFEKFSGTVAQLFDCIEEKENKYVSFKFNTCYNLLKLSTSVQNCFLAMRVMPRKTDSQKEVLNKIVTILGAVQNDSVKICFDNFLDNDSTL